MTRGRRLKKEPIKAGMGKWNFKVAEKRDRRTMWLVECDCKRTVQWMAPYALKESSQCVLCSNEAKKETWKLGKEQRNKNKAEEWDDKDFLQFEEEKVAPDGQLSLASLPPEEPVKQQSQLDEADIKLLGQAEYFLEIAMEIVSRLKEAHLRGK